MESKSYCIIIRSSSRRPLMPSKLHVSAAAIGLVLVFCLYSADIFRKVKSGGIAYDSYSQFQLRRTYDEQGCRKGSSKDTREELDLSWYRYKGGDRGGNIKRRRRQLLSGIGSAPPRCIGKCGNCVPCKPVHVPVPPGNPITAEYYPEAWRCKCGNKLFMP